MIWVMKDELDVNKPEKRKAGFAGWTPCIQSNGFGVRERGTTIGEAGNRIGRSLEEIYVEP